MLREMIVNDEQKDGPNPLSLYSVIVSEAIKLWKCSSIFVVLSFKNE